MKFLVGGALALFLAICVIVGFSRHDALKNSSEIVVAPVDDAGSDFAATEGTPCAAVHQQYSPYLDNVKASGWRPDGGIIDGMGCCDAGPDICECARCGCPDAFPDGLPNEGYYYLFTQFTACRGFLGGQLIFEKGGYNSVVIFPLPLLFVIGFFALAIASRTSLVQHWIHRRVASPYQGNSKALNFIFSNTLTGPITFKGPEGFKRGEFVMLLWLIAVLCLCGGYLFEHARVNNLVGRISRSLGGVCVGIVALIIFPVSRHSVLLPLFGIPFDRALRFHKFLGALFFFATTLHMLWMGVNYVQVYQRGDPKLLADGTRIFVNQVGFGEAVKLMLKRMVSWGVGFPHGPPLAGLLAWLVTLAMTVTTCFRRTKWELFLVTHMGFLLVFAFTFVHYPTTILYCAPAVLSYAVDLALRFRYSRIGGGQIVTAEYFEEAGITKLTIQPGESFRPVGAGHFVTIAVPALDRYPGIVLESHPFSVSSHLPGGGFTCHIKNMGETSWTGRVAKAAQDGRLSNTKARVDGPFGRLSPDLSHAGQAVILLCGGVGVTPMLNILQHFTEEPALLPPSRRVVFVWSVRFANQIDPFKDTLQRIITAAASMPITIRIFETSRQPSEPAVAAVVQVLADVESIGLMDPAPSTREELLPSPSDDHPLLEISFGRKPQMSEFPLAPSSCNGPVHTQAGRPPLSDILQCQGGETSDDVTVYVCGPPPLVTDTEARCHKVGFVCHAETFLF